MYLSQSFSVEDKSAKNRFFGEMHTQKNSFWFLKEPFFKKLVLPNPDHGEFRSNTPCYDIHVAEGLDCLGTPALQHRSEAPFMAPLFHIEGKGILILAFVI